MQGTEAPSRFLLLKYISSFSLKRRPLTATWRVSRCFPEVEVLPAFTIRWVQPLPFPTSWPWGSAVWGRDFPDENVSLQDSPSASPPFSAEGLGFLLLCEQGDQGRLSGGGVEAGTLAGWLHGLLRARLELVCVLSPWSSSCSWPRFIWLGFKCHPFSVMTLNLRSCLRKACKLPWGYLL